MDSFIKMGRLNNAKKKILGVGHCKQGLIELNLHDHGFYKSRDIIHFQFGKFGGQVILGHINHHFGSERLQSLIPILRLDSLSDKAFHHEDILI